MIIVRQCRIVSLLLRLQAFQPTIKELQQVSQDFKSAIEQEVRRSTKCVHFCADTLQINADDTKTPARSQPSPALDDALNEEMRKASAAAAWGAQAPPSSDAPPPPPAGTVQPGKLPDLRAD